MKLRFGSVCSGIEAATVAWHSLGWEAAWYSEIDPFCKKLLAHHYPETPNLGDMTKLLKRKETTRGSIDVLVGGTPCQSFSIAGLRKGLADPRGNLALVFLGLVDRLRPRWVVWENVPGVLSSWTDEATHPPSEGTVEDLGAARRLGEGLAEEVYGPGRELEDFRRTFSEALDPGRFEEADQLADFDTFLRGFRELGYGVAWRVLDAVHTGVPQRRRRVFVVGHLGATAPAQAVLLERHSLSGDPPPSRAARQDAAGTLKGGDGTGDRAIAADHGAQQQNYVAEPGPQIFESRVARNGRGAPTDECPPLKAENGADGRGDGAPLVLDQYNQAASPESFPLRTALGDGIPVAGGPTMTVRRLTPLECERLMGFPDTYTLVPTYRTKVKTEDLEEVAAYLGIPVEEARAQGVTPDGPRYKALGNSIAIPPLRWIGERIELVEQALKEAR